MTDSDPFPERLPGPVYLDSSALAKIYLPEPASDALDEALRSRRDLMVSDLAVTEVIAALARRRRERAISPPIAARLHRAILRDAESGMFLRLGLSTTVHREAERLMMGLDTVALRSADALHLALAVSASAATVVSFDKRLAEAAEWVGLFVAPARSD